MLTQISPEFTLARSSDMIARPDVRADVADAGDGAQLGSGARDDPRHLRVRDAGRAVPVDQQVALAERRQWPSAPAGATARPTTIAAATTSHAEPSPHGGRDACDERP